MSGLASLLLVAFAWGTPALAQDDPLPSWNDGPVKQAIVNFVQATTDQSSTKFVPPAERIATFDQDGTLWVSHPMYTQVVYCLDRVPAVVKEKPQLAKVEPFKTVLSRNREAIAKLSMDKDPKLLLNDNNAGKPEGIHLMIGRRPYVAFGNSTGDRQMLEYTKAGEGDGLAMLVLHDDAQREYAYGPALGLPDTKVGTFTQALYDEARKNGWTVISMKNDWKRIFAFE